MTNSIDFHQIMRWFSGNQEAGILAIAAGVAEPVAWLVRWTRRAMDSKVLETLRAAVGDSGVGYTEDQIAGQSGSEPRRLRSGLRRLERSGEVRQANGRWYITGTKRRERRSGRRLRPRT